MVNVIVPVKQKKQRLVCHITYHGPESNAHMLGQRLPLFSRGDPGRGAPHLGPIHLENGILPQDFPSPHSQIAEGAEDGQISLDRRRRLARSRQLLLFLVDGLGGRPPAGA